MTFKQAMVLASDMASAEDLARDDFRRGAQDAREGRPESARGGRFYQAGWDLEADDECPDPDHWLGECDR